MSSHRTAWHVAFAALLTERAPPGFVVQPEVPLGSEPQRVDLLLVRRTEPVANPAPARVLRRLWPHIAHEALVEFKSISRPFRRGDLARLLGYGAQRHAAHVRRLPEPAHVMLVLVVAAMTPSLREELSAMNWQLRPGTEGYYEASSSPYPLWVVMLDEVAQAERDELAGSFGHAGVQTLEGWRWWQRQLGGGKMEITMEMTEEIEEVARQLLESLPVELRLVGLTLEQRLTGLAPEVASELLRSLPIEQRLAGLAPEQRLAGLAPEETLLALPLDVLRKLPDEYIQGLPEPVRSDVRKRLSST